jgi:NitT/TauT family transport system ATP-binding protein
MRREGAATEMLKISALSKLYVDARHRTASRSVLTGIDLTVAENQFVCLLGPSGCGKTTLLRAVAGLVTPDAGQILLDGRPVHGPGQDRSIMFQNYGLLPWRTVMGNVELGLEVRGVAAKPRRATCQLYIDRVGLHGFENHYPHQISGGMQQRVALARALSKQPRLLLMDEPFAAVDMQTREQLQDELLSVWETFHTTILFVTHSIEEAVYLADRVIVMSPDAGRIRGDIPIDLPRPRQDLRSAKPERLDHFVTSIRQLLRSFDDSQVAA